MAWNNSLGVKSITHVTGTKSKCQQSHPPSRGSSGESISLYFPPFEAASHAFLSSWSFRHQSNQRCSSLCLYFHLLWTHGLLLCVESLSHSLWLGPLWLHLVLTQIVQLNCSISKSIILLHLMSLLPLCSEIRFTINLGALINFLHCERYFKNY